MPKEQQPVQTKVLSVRVPEDEAERIEALAAEAGLTRNDYLRSRFVSAEAAVDVHNLDDLIKALRQLECIFDRYVGVLEDLSRRFDDQGDAQIIELLETEIERAESLIRLSFKAQKKAARILQRIRRKIA